MYVYIYKPPAADAYRLGAMWNAGTAHIALTGGPHRCPLYPVNTRI